MPAGRPSKYKPEFAEQAQSLCEGGAIKVDLAAYFDVAESTVDKWLKEKPDFSGAVKKGRAVSDMAVVDSLYNKALAGDVTAMIFWLKNRRAEQWRDVKESKVDMTVTERVKNDAESFKGRITSLTARSGGEGIPRKPH